jgi:acetyl esterase
MTYRFDPELVPWLAELPAIDLSDPASVRAASAAQRGQAPRYESPIPLTVADRLVPGLGTDPDVPVRVYYIAKNAAELGVDPRHIGVAGNSAGAGLAAAAALMARDQGGPELCMQYLSVPELDDRRQTPSMRAFTDTPVANRANVILTWQHYLAGQQATAYAAPARAADLTGLPPSYVAVCEFDPLRDEGIEYAQRLVQAGVPVELHLYPGTFHGSSRIAGAAVSQRMSRDSLEAIHRLLRA